jgi:xanthine dehydrogenase YagR molybdenum-binding subunit
VDERDQLTSPIGMMGLGEIGIVGTAAAVANAIFHATGKRLRGLPMTPDRVLFG